VLPVYRRCMRDIVADGLEVPARPRGPSDRCRGHDVAQRPGASDSDSVRAAAVDMTRSAAICAPEGDRLRSSHGAPLVPRCRAVAPVATAFPSRSTSPPTGIGSPSVSSSTLPQHEQANAVGPIVGMPVRPFAVGGRANSTVGSRTVRSALLISEGNTVLIVDSPAPPEIHGATM